MTKLKSIEDLELEKLEREFENLTKNQNKGIPYKEYIKKQKQQSNKKDKILNELEKDLAIEYLKDLQALQNKYKNLDKKLKKTEKKAKKVLKANSKLGFDYNKTLNEKLNINDVIKQKTKKDKKALGGAFKISYLQFDNQKNSLGDINIIKSRMQNKLEYEFINSDKKYSYVCFVAIKYVVKTHIEDKLYLVQQSRYFNSHTINLTSINIIKNFINRLFEEFLVDLEGAKLNSSTVFSHFETIKIYTSKTKAIAGKSFIELPDWIKNKNACVNIKNDDNKCFKWALLAYKYYDKIKNKDKNKPVYYKKYWDEIIEPDNFEYPVKLSDIEKFEKLNDIKINVIEIMEDKEDFTPIRTSNIINKNVVNLLLIHQENNSHYVWIKNINRLYASKTIQHKKYVCEQCLCKAFTSQEGLDKHIKDKKCQAFDIEQQPTLGVMPEEGDNIQKFINYNNEFLHPFHVLADFESTLEKVVEREFFKSTVKYQRHIQNSFGLKYNCIHDEFSEDIKIVNSSNPEELNKQFIEELEKLAKKSYNLLQQNKTNIIFTPDERIKYISTTKCEKCSCEFSKTNKKVKHHDHINGKFLGAFCNKCNLEYQYKTFLPVYIHNLKGYDAHLFIKSLYKYGFQSEKGNNLHCIPNNEERYISFSKIIKVSSYTDKNTKKQRDVLFEIRFLDTIAFLNSSIEQLSENLKNGCNTIEEKRMKFKNVSHKFKNDEQFEMMIQKGIYPYDYIDKYERLNETKLPKQSDFDSLLYNTKCNKDDYERAVNVWNKFDCKTFMDYHNLYLTTDVLLLADIWENFRSVCYNVYKLDCEYYYTAPSLSYDAMLKHTKIEIELLTNLEMFEFVESGIRGGVSQISKRHAIANNKYMKNYDESKEDSYIVYLDANNLYGYAMCEYLPYKDFKWNSNIWNKENILAIDDKSNKGYLFSVDLHIPETLHDHFNNYVPCPENIKINKDDLNKWQQENYNNSNVKKLCLTFYDKKNYVINYRYLKLVLSLGVELVKVNKVLEYTQKDFMKSYIMLNTELRQKAKNDFEKDFFKLMNNSVYGKTMENVRNRIDFRLINNEDQALRVKNMKRFSIFDESLVGVHIHKQQIKLNKPIFLGQNILDDSKHLMFNFHYNFMFKNIKRENINLLFTDTDSLCYNIRNQDIFEIMKNNKSLFDLSNYAKNNELYDKTNAKVMGKFKNESPLQITEFIGLRAKLYCFTVDGEEESHNKCKGIKHHITSKLMMADYRKTLYTRKSKEINQNGIRSYKHQIYTETITKTALSCNDDKVFICDDNIHTRNLGHYKNKKSLFSLEREFEEKLKK